MNYTQFLHDLHEEISSSQKSDKKQIIRFKNKVEYQQFIKSLRRWKTKLSQLKQIKPISIISGFTCPLQSTNRFKQFPPIQFIENDVKMNVHFDSPIARNTSALTDSESEIPWGIQQIKVPKAWNYAKGKSIKIGVIDTGIDYQHPNLRPSLSYGINLLNPLTFPNDDNGHGTHIAGTIAAAKIPYGIIGVAPQASIHPVKAFDYQGSAYVSDIIQAIDWCAYHKMNIINMSFGMKTYSKSLEDAVKNAESAGSIIVASSGNDYKKESVDYPARFPQVISVGATTQNHKIASFSNQGKRIDVYAPGERIYSTWPRGKYHVLSGTSMATSHVTGVVALILSRNPHLSALQVKRILQKTANPLKSVHRKTTTLGEINALRVVRYMQNSSKRSFKKIPKRTHKKVRS